MQSRSDTSLENPVSLKRHSAAHCAAPGPTGTAHLWWAQDWREHLRNL